MLIVVVEFIIDPERLAEFMPLMLNNARTSLAEEPGCHQFDVCASEEAPATSSSTRSTTTPPPSRPMLAVRISRNSPQRPGR